ncbi:hypothetical protein B0H15DRAFT_785504 [Mycena belliarum]|uniref:Uncharacterized protein n=1 Tax=Mycena belliarum TaxID=1033014 RepID=A0AAD6U1F0_9AGAR|nr:hypothetical protein B0H15DRAFT_785504 [Mycena belliae]
MGLIVPDVPITLPDGSRSHRRDSWRIIVRHWTEGDPSHGLTTPLKDWPKMWLTGVNKLFALTRVYRYNSDEKAFLAAYPEAEEGSSKLLAAINDARRARGDLVTRK